MAKGWNYEAEQLIRKSGIDYTIIRPGIMKESVDDESVTLGFKDNGGDLKVSAVSFAQIADFAIQSLSRDNLQRATVTAMNVDSDNDDFQTLEQIRPDTRVFPESLIDEHKKAARAGGIGVILFTLFLAKSVTSIIGKIVGFKK
jgi:hypothetical protein